MQTELMVQSKLDGVALAKSFFRSFQKPSAFSYKRGMRVIISRDGGGTVVGEVMDVSTSESIARVMLETELPTEDLRLCLLENGWKEISSLQD